MKTNWCGLILTGLLVLSSVAQGQWFMSNQNPQTNQSLCTICSIGMKQTLDYYGVVPPLAQAGKTRVAVAFARMDAMSDAEESAIGKIKKQLEAKPHLNAYALSGSLIEKATRDQVQYALYYQFGVDAAGKSSLRNEAGTPAPILDQKDPHEFFGFFQNIKNQPFIIFNAYQDPIDAQFTAVHELAHLYDDKSAQYIENQKKLESWTPLDSLVMEFRAYAYELLHFEQYKRLQERVSLKDLNYRQNERAKFISNGVIDTRKAADYVLNLFYPLNASGAHLLSMGEDAKIINYSFSGQRKTLREIPTSIIENGILQTLSWFFGDYLDSYLTNGRPGFTVALLNYSSSSAESSRIFSLEQRKLIQEELIRRGSQSFHEYLQKQDLLSDLQGLPQLRMTGTNKYFHQHGGPRPRVGGGGRGGGGGD